MTKLTRLIIILVCAAISTPSLAAYSKATDQTRCHQDNSHSCQDFMVVAVSGDEVLDAMKFLSDLFSGGIEFKRQRKREKFERKEIERGHEIEMREMELQKDRIQLERDQLQIEDDDIDNEDDSQ